MASRARTIIRRAPQAVRTIAVRSAPVVRRVGSAAARAAADEKHTLMAAAGAGLLGYLDKNGHLDSWSLIDGVDPKTQIALGLWAVGKFTKNKIAQHVATGAIAVAIYSMVKES